MKFNVKKGVPCLSDFPEGEVLLFRGKLSSGKYVFACGPMESFSPEEGEGACVISGKIRVVFKYPSKRVVISSISTGTLFPDGRVFLRMPEGDWIKIDGNVAFFRKKKFAKVFPLDG